MTEYQFDQLVDLEKIRNLLQVQYKITGICSGILDLDQNILLAEGWQDICTRFHREHPITRARCLESDEIISHRLHEVEGFRERICRNGLRDIAMPIVIDGRHLATFFTGQFFYADDFVDEGFFCAQAAEFGFDEEEYLAALRRVPIFTRDQVRNIMVFYRNLVQIMGESGLQKLELVREIEEREKAEKAQQASKNFLEKIINSISDPIFVKDRQHRLVLVNEAECALAGRGREEMVGRTDYDFFPREQVDIFWEKDELVFQTGEPNVNEEEITDGQGETRVIVTKKSLYWDKDGTPFLVGIIRDITERKRAEEELRRKREGLAQAQRIGRMGSWELDLASGTLIWSDEIYRIFEMDPASFGASYQAFLAAIHPEDRKRVNESYTSSVANREPYDIEHRLLFADGRIKYVRERCETAYDPTGKPLRSCGTVQDITESKQAAERLALLNFALDHVHEAVYLIDEHARFLYVNQEACRVLGYRRNELPGMGIGDIDPGWSKEDWYNTWPSFRTRGALTVETNHRARDGRIIPVEVNASYFEYQGQAFNLALVRDITERRKTEDINLGRLRLLQFAEAHTLDEFLRATLDEVERLTGSVIGFYHFLEADQKTLCLQGWSTRTVAKFCSAAGKGMKYDVAEAGVWADCVRERRAVVHNDYGSLPGRRGLPPGHPPVVRELVVPVMRGDRIVAILGVGNKPENYTLGDVETVSIFADLVWEVTDRKRAEAMLRESEQRFREIFDNSLDCLYLLEVTEDGRFRNLEVNPALEKSVDMSRDELIGRYVDETVPEETAQKVIAKYRRCLETGTAIEEEATLELPSGRRMYHSTLVPVRSEAGRIHRIVGITRDITERKLTEELLRKREQEFRTLAENSPDVIVRYDRNLRRLYVNPAFEKLNRLSPQEVLGKTPFELSTVLMPKVRLFAQKLKEAMETGVPNEIELTSKRSPENHVSYFARIIPEFDSKGEVVSALALFNDISERKRMEEQLRASEQQFRTLVENSPDIILRYDRDCRRVYVNPAFERETGIPSGMARHLVLGSRWLADNIKAEEYAATLREVMETGKAAEIFLEWPRRGDGRMTSHAVHMVADRDMAGRVVGVLAIGHNITALKEAELRLAKLAATLPGFLFTYCLKSNGASCIPYASPRIRDIFGLAPESVAEDATELFSRIHPDDLRYVQDSIGQSAQHLTPWHDEFRVQHPEKGVLWIEGRSMPRAQPDGAILWYGFLHDITEQKNLEQELFKAKKMEIIGQLAGGVAHEVRNPLNAILSIAEALFKEKEIADNPDYQPYIKHIRTQVWRLSKLMTDLLDLGKPIRSTSISPVSLAEICTEAVNLWKLTELSHTHSLEYGCDFSVDNLQVNADAGRLQQVLLNLVENAAQHSPAGSAIRLHVLEAAGSRLILQIRDAGTGMPPEKIGRVFEPFFTTRRGGTGLGLSLVKHLVENMGGEVSIRNNEPPPGCTVELVLGVAGEQEDRGTGWNGS